MDYLTLPLDLNLINELDPENTSIDMSDLKFPCINEHMIRSAFIFLRNIDMNFNLDFSKCSYDMKEQYMLSYLQGDINLNIPSIRDTWIDVLISKYSNVNNILGFFSSDEIIMFYNKNKIFINEINNLIASLTVLGLHQYCKSNNDAKKIIQFEGEFEETDYDDINFYNFSLLTESEYFGILLQSSNDFTPKFYSKYFNDDNQIPSTRINMNLPIINLLNILFAPSDIQNSFIDKLDDMINNHNT